MNQQAIVCVLLSVLVLLDGATAHSFLTGPTRDHPDACANKVNKEGRRWHTCDGPCDPKGLIQKDPGYTPRASYQRGESVVLSYARNNHAAAGFVRFTLVPRDQSMSKEAHDAGAFHYSCWGANEITATEEQKADNADGYSMVGSDKSLFWQVTVKIPDVYPDGEYVLGYAWYGGVGWSGYWDNEAEAFFGDYWSCALVTIRGGAFSESFQPVFYNDRGTDASAYSPDGCMSSVDRLGICFEEPCRSPRVEPRVPYPFQNGNLPPPITPATFRFDSPVISSAEVPAPKPESVLTADDNTAVVAEEEQVAEAAASDPECTEGVLSQTYFPNGNKICCAASCEVCGGGGCGGRPGGADSCCHGRIRDASLSCATHRPPCLIIV